MAESRVCLACNGMPRSKLFLSKFLLCTSVLVMLALLLQSESVAIADADIHLSRLELQKTAAEMYNLKQHVWQQHLHLVSERRSLQNMQSGIR